ncbi:MAG: VWA domain-containing protein [Pseudomonadota bacterium]
MPEASQPDIAGLVFAMVLGAPDAFGGVVIRGPVGPARDALLAALPAGRRLPLNAEPERVLGGIDLSATLAAGRPILQPGILADNAGPLTVPSAERLPAETAGLLSEALDGIAVGPGNAALPIPTVIALDEGEADDPPLDPRLAERLAFVLPAGQAAPLTVPALPATWRETDLPDDLRSDLAAAALRCAVLSMRNAAQVSSAARALAALAGRAKVSPAEAELAFALVAGPRAVMPAPQEEPPSPQPPPPPDDTDAENPPPPTDPGDVERPDEDRLVDAAAAMLDEGLLAGLGRLAPRSAVSGRAGQTVKGGRGRPAGVRQGLPGRAGRLALAETLTAAAPWSRVRGSQPGKVSVRASDLRIRRTKSRAATLTIICVDASGSQAFARMAEAKGAVELLLAKAYVRRDQVALVAFRKEEADVLLPPTTSLTRVKRALAALPGGGGTPLAAGIEAGLRLSLRAINEGRQPTLVVLTDGRANVPLVGQGRAQAQTDAQALAKSVARAGVASVVIDTATRASPKAAELAAAMGARYAPLRQGGAKAIVTAAEAARAR